MKTRLPLFAALVAAVAAFLASPSVAFQRPQEPCHEPVNKSGIVAVVTPNKIPELVQSCAYIVHLVEVEGEGKVVASFGTTPEKLTSLLPTHAGYPSAGCTVKPCPRMALFIPAGTYVAFPPQDAGIDGGIGGGGSGYTTCAGNPLMEGGGTGSGYNHDQLIQLAKEADSSRDYINSWGK